jgi:hypothetical protein
MISKKQKSMPNPRKKKSFPKNQNHSQFKADHCRLYILHSQLRKPGGQRAGREDVEDVQAEREHIGKIIRDRRV